MRKSLIVIIISIGMVIDSNATVTLPHHLISRTLPRVPLDFSMDIPARPYTQFDFGTSRLINSDNQNLPSKMIFSRHVTVGMEFDGNRVGLYFTNFGRYKWQAWNEGTKKQVILDINEFGLSYMHTLELKSIFSPYLGIRVGYAHFKLRNTYLDTAGGYFAESGNHNHVSIGAFGGVETKISHNFTVGLGIEYGLLRGNDTTDLTSKAFTRFYF